RDAAPAAGRAADAARVALLGEHGDRRPRRRVRGAAGDDPDPAAPRAQVVARAHRGRGARAWPRARPRPRVARDDGRLGAQPPAARGEMTQVVPPTSTIISTDWRAVTFRHA